MKEAPSVIFLDYGVVIYFLMKMYVSPSLLRQYAAVFVVNLSILTTGMSMAWPSPVVLKLSNPEETPLTSFLTVEEGSWLVSLGFFGGAFAVSTGSVLFDVFGRKKCLILSSVPKIAMGFLCIFASEAWVLILARTLMVTVDCFIYTAVPIYASEIADKYQRGALGSFVQVFSAIGSVVTLSVGPFTSYKIFNIFFTTLIVVTSLPLLWLPESPFFLYKTGREKESIDVLKQLRTSDNLVIEEINDYKISCSKLQKNMDKIKLFKNKIFLKSLALGVLLNVGTQAIGFNAVLFYLQTILESTKTRVKPEIASVIVGIIQVLAGFSTIFITKRFGRRTILLVTLSGVVLGMMGLGTFFYLRGPKEFQIKGFMNYLPIISLILVIFSHTIGIGSLVWLITPEVFDSHSRAVGASLSIVTTTLSIFITTKYFPYMIISLGPAITYWFFASLTIILMILLASFLTETKDKTFYEIQIALGDSKPVIDMYPSHG